MASIQDLFDFVGLSDMDADDWTIASTPLLGEALDELIKSPYKATPFFLVAGIGMDVANRVLDEPGFTWRDAAAVAAGIGGGAVGAGLGTLLGGPGGAMLGGFLGGSSATRFVDKFPDPQVDPNAQTIILAYGMPNGQTRLEIHKLKQAGAVQGDLMAMTMKIFGADGKLVSSEPYPNYVVPDGLETLNLLRRSVVGPHCFPAGTAIRLFDGETRPVERLRLEEVVYSYDPDAQTPAAVGLPKRVTNLFQNITDSWIVLSNGLTVTPGHHFLDAFGKFRTIEDILRTDSQIVLADGTITNVTGEYIHYSEATAHLYEQAEGYVSATVGNLALAPVYKKGWKTYNFEVEDYHTYIAGGVRVHNASVFTASGSDLDIGLHTNANGDVLEVNPNGSITNHSTGYTSPASIFADGRIISAAAIGVSGQQQSDLANLGAFARWQETGSGPSVTLASGKVVPAGTVFAAGDGYTSVVNSDGSVTNLKTGYTTAAPGGTLVDPHNNSYAPDDVVAKYNPSTGNFDHYAKPGATPSESHNSGGKSGQSDHNSPSSSSPNSSSPSDNDSNGSGSGKPVLLDLDGDGIEIMQLGSSDLGRGGRWCAGARCGQ